MKQEGFLGKLTIQSVIFFAVFVLFFILVARLLMPFFTIILWAAILYVILDPLYIRISGIKAAKVKGKKVTAMRRALSASLISILAVTVIVVPLGFLAFLLVRQSSQVLGDILDYLKNHPFLFKPVGTDDSQSLAPLVNIGEFLSTISNGAIDLGSINLRDTLINLLRSNQRTIVNLSTRLVQNLGGFVISLAFMTFTLYFFFMDGHYLLGIFTKAVPIKNEYMQKFIRSFKETTRQLIQGNLLVSIIQGTIAFLLFLAFQVKGALLLSVLVAVCSFIPMVGASAVWLPVGLTYILTRDPLKGAILLILSGVGISLLDNFYRPILVGGPIKIHPLPIFFAIVGGISIFGINGLIIGPLILALFFAALDIFREISGIPKTPGEMEEATEKSKVEEKLKPEPDGA